DAVVAAEAANVTGEVDVVDEFGVAEDARRLAEQILDHLRVQVDLLAKLIAAVDAREAVVVRFAEELDAAASRQLLQQFDDARALLAQLLDEAAGDRVGDAELLAVALDEFEDEFGRGQVALGGDLVEDLRVAFGVEVVAAGVEHAVPPQPQRLMHLEVKTDG